MWSQSRANRGVLLILCFILTGISAANAGNFYVATNGNDSTGDGSAGRPWRTIAHAVNTGVSAAGGHTILVKNGVYDGYNTLRRGFPSEVIVRAEEEFGAILTNLVNGDDILQVFVQGSANLTIEGFVITNEGTSGATCTGRTNYMVHFSDASDVLFRNNIVYGTNRAPHCNDMIKVNRSSPSYFPKNIRIVGNVLYNHPAVGGVDIIDSVRPGEIDICENIFFSDLGVNAGWAFITLKRESPAPSGTTKSPRYNVSRNVFLNFEAADPPQGLSFVQFGEDGWATHEITNALIENNLFIGNSANRLAAPIQLKGTKGITVRANTVVGDLPGRAYGFRIGTDGSNPTVSDIFVYNNVWSDPTGTMGRFADVYGLVDTSTIFLKRNLFWNGGAAISDDGSVKPSDDPEAIVADPGIEPNHAGIVLPKWDKENRVFPSGSQSIRAEFERLVMTYGALSPESPAVDAADPENMPEYDILGFKRDGNPDLGAVEFGASVRVVETNSWSSVKSLYRK